MLTVLSGDAFIFSSSGVTTGKRCGAKAMRGGLIPTLYANTCSTRELGTGRVATNHRYAPPLAYSQRNNTHQLSLEFLRFCATYLVGLIPRRPCGVLVPKCYHDPSLKANNSSRTQIRSARSDTSHDVRSPTYPLCPDCYICNI